MTHGSIKTGQNSVSSKSVYSSRKIHLSSVLSFFSGKQIRFILLAIWKCQQLSTPTVCRNGCLPHGEIIRGCLRFDTVGLTLDKPAKRLVTIIETVMYFLYIPSTLLFLIIGTIGTYRRPPSLITTKRKLERLFQLFKTGPTG